MKNLDKSEATGSASVGDLYDGMADAYARDAENNPYNALYERPATVALLPPLAGLDVLDVGSGPGHLATYLAAEGARVTGIDISRRMVALAETRKIPNSRFCIADLAEELPFPADSFDLVVASLVLHYLRDWTKPLRELRRVLRPGGALIGSVHHPACDLGLSPSGNYFETELIRYRWSLDGKSWEVGLWRRPLRSMLAAFEETDWTLERLEEPDPLPAARDAEAWRTLTTEPVFLLFRLRP